METKEETSNKKHNVAIFKKIKSAEKLIDDLRSQLKPVEPIKNATLAECNAMARKSKVK
jgi:hypothetical protein